MPTAHLRVGGIACVVLSLVVVTGGQLGRDRATSRTGSVTRTAAIALGVRTDGVPENPGRLDAFAALVGARPAIVMWYQDWVDPGGRRFNPAGMDAVVARGAVPMVTWEPWDDARPAPQPAFALRNVASGDYDAYLRQWAADAAAWGRPFYLRFAHEMNGGWYPWGAGVNGNTAADYVSAWRHVVALFRQAGATNVVWVWSPNASFAGRYPFAAYYPGDDWVDWVGLDGYNWGALEPSGWRSVGAIFGASYDALTALTDKPVMIAETASAEAGGDKADWITQGLLRDVPRRLPRVRAVVWFDRNKETDWRVNSSPAALLAYRRVAAAPLYAGTG